MLDFIYDNQGKPFALKYSANGGSSFSTYYYILNLQGDVVKLINTSGTTVASYTYNAWGEILSSSGTMADINPLRYRGYYYDSETGFYYLQSRYYDPVTHRFINADTYESTDINDVISCNMFAYCNNNPVKYGDPEGDFLGALFGAVVGAVVGAVNAAIEGNNIWAGAATGAAAGALTGLAVDAAVATGGVAGVAIAFVGCGAAGFCESIANDAINGKSIDWVGATISGITNAIGGVLSFGVAGGSLKKVGGNIIKNMIRNDVNTVLEGAVKTVGKTAAKQTTKYVGRKIAKNLAYQAAQTTITSFGSWYAAKRVSRAVESVS